MEVSLAKMDGDYMLLPHTTTLLEDALRNFFELIEVPEFPVDLSVKYKVLSAVNTTRMSLSDDWNKDKSYMVSEVAPNGINPEAESSCDLMCGYLKVRLVWHLSSGFEASALLKHIVDNPSLLTVFDESIEPPPPKMAEVIKSSEVVDIKPEPVKVIQPKKEKKSEVDKKLDSEKYFDVALKIFACLKDHIQNFNVSNFSIKQIKIDKKLLTCLGVEDFIQVEFLLNHFVKLKPCLIGKRPSTGLFYFTDHFITIRNRTKHERRRAELLAQGSNGDDSAKSVVSTIVASAVKTKVSVSMSASKATSMPDSPTSEPENPTSDSSVASSDLAVALEDTSASFAPDAVAIETVEATSLDEVSYGFGPGEVEVEPESEPIVVALDEIVPNIVPDDVAVEEAPLEHEVAESEARVSTLPLPPAYMEMDGQNWETDIDPVESAITKMRRLQLEGLSVEYNNLAAMLRNGAEIMDAASVAGLSVAVKTWTDVETMLSNVMNQGGTIFRRYKNLMK